MSIDFNSLLLSFIPLFVAIDVFRNSKYVYKVLGKTGARVVSKVASLFMVAIAVMMIRVGLTGMINQ